jgi:enoyl-[acyl-carrier protein] reductase III
LDAAVSLAGGGTAWIPIVESDAQSLAEAIRNNLEVAFNLIVPALRAMLRQAPLAGARSRGRLIAVTAGSSLDPAPSRGLMGIGKAGVNTLMRAIASEHKADGIVANAVVLGGVATEAARDYLDAADFAAAATPQEVADVLAFHASDASSGINGELIHLNARETD